MKGLTKYLGFPLKNEFYSRGPLPIEMSDTVFYNEEFYLGQIESK
jgi:hypothetical protein